MASQPVSVEMAAARAKRARDETVTARRLPHDDADEDANGSDAGPTEAEPASRLPERAD
jgi:hypothetical protein